MYFHWQEHKVLPLESNQHLSLLQNNNQHIFYRLYPIKRGDIVKVTNQHKEPKKKKIDGQWQKIDEQEWWVTEYQIC